MKFIEKGTANHSFKINIFGIKVRFRNRLAFQNNKILLIDEKGNETRVEKINGLKVDFRGANSVIRIHKPCPKFENTTITCGDNVCVSIGGSKHRIANSHICATASESNINIGKNNFIRGIFIASTDKSGISVNIGDDCLIANGVRLLTTDFHTVIDNETKQVLNPPEDINIGNHCWLCEDVTIKKGVKLPKDTIVASKAYVTKSFEKTNTIIGGIPASIIKDKNTSWSVLPYWQYVESLKST